MKISLLSLLARAFVYMLFVAGLAYLVALEGFRMGTGSEYSEHSLTEWLESGFSLLSGLIFVAVARFDRILRPMAAMLAALCFMMFIREADFFLDAQVFDGAWQLLVTGVLLSISLYLWRQQEPIAVSIQTYAQQPSAGILLSGFLVLFVFSRLFGRESFWQSVMGEGYIRVVKNIAEEGTEILGYGLITIAAFELLYISYSRLRNSRNS